MDSEKSSLVMIGLDGVSTKLLETWNTLGLIDFYDSLNFKSINSTRVPLTFTANATIYTGRDPEKHGLFDFTYPAKEGSSVNIRTYNHKKLIGQRFFDILAMRGQKVITINAPITYGSWKLKYKSLQMIYDNISTPSTAWKYLKVYSLNLDPYIKKAFKETGFIKTYDLSRYSYHIGYEDKFVVSLTNMLSIRKNFLKKIKTKLKEFDLVLIYFTETDSLLHNIWYVIDKESPHYNSIVRLKTWKYIRKFFSVLNEILNIASDVSENILLYSDHGFTYINKKFYPNVIFRKYNLLEFNRRHMYDLHTRMYKSFLTSKNLRSIAVTLLSIFPHTFKEKVIYKSIKDHGFQLSSDFNYFENFNRIDAIAWVTRNMPCFYVYVLNTEIQDRVMDVLESFPKDIVNKVIKIDSKEEPRPNFLVTLNEGYVAEPIIPPFSDNVYVTNSVFATGSHAIDAMAGTSSTLSSKSIKKIHDISEYVLKLL